MEIFNNNYIKILLMEPLFNINVGKLFNCKLKEITLWKGKF